MTALTPPRSDSEGLGCDPLLAVACPACHAALAAPRAAAGKPARCPVCQGEFLMPLSPRREETGGDHRADEAAEGLAVDPIRGAREVRAIRRTRRNLLMLFSGGSILLAIVLLFGSRRPRKRR